MKIAVSIGETGTISSHLGKSKIFFIFSKDGEEIKFLERRLSEGNHTNHIIEDIKDCDVVISGKIGDGMIESLKKMGITAVVEEKVLDPMEAIAKLS